MLYLIIYVLMFLNILNRILMCNIMPVVVIIRITISANINWHLYYPSYLYFYACVSHLRVNELFFFN